jgi:hypothetical protein
VETPESYYVPAGIMRSPVESPGSGVVRVAHGLPMLSA